MATSSYDQAVGYELDEKCINIFERVCPACYM